MTCDIRYDSPMMTELATFPPLGRLAIVLSVSGIGLGVTGVALLTGKLRRKVHP